MIDRVARAIKAELWRQHEVSEDIARNVARAAILAIREPTEAMCKANWTQPIGGGVDEGYRAMIDEALK